MTRHSLWAAALTFSVLATACGGGAEDARTDDPGNAPDQPSSTSSTEAPEPAKAEYRDVGPFGVGAVTLTLPTGNEVEVYYPSDAVEPNGGLEAYRVRSFLPPVIEATIPAEVDDEFKVPAEREVEAVDGPLPLVLFSHGFSGFRLQSTHLLTHLASWGMVVASPDHPSRDLESQINASIGVTEGEPQDSVADIQAAIDLVRAESDDPDSVLSGLVDPDLLAIGGHSAGGGTALAATTAIPGMLGYISYASGARDETELPDVPSLFLAGANDGVIEPGRAAEAFEAAAEPSWRWELADSGHLAFSDLCAIGQGQGGLIGLAEEAGLPVPENLRGLAEDGCLEPNVDVRTVWPAIDHSSVAFYRFVFGIDDEPVGLGPEVTEAFDVDVTIEEKP